MRPTQLPSLLMACAALVSALALTARADDVVLPSSNTASAAPTTPARGIAMSKVEAQFGTPAERHAAVGKPPITRWDYPGFSVYFEYDHVIHSVVK